MEDTGQQSTGSQPDTYLQTPRAFHLEMPLYYEIDLSQQGALKTVFNLLSFSGTLDAYCIWCDKESVFNASEYDQSTYSYWEQASEFTRNTYRCSRDADHTYYSYYLKTKDRMIKIGQWPSVADFQIPQAQKYRKVLGENEYKELTKGIGLSAHGVGIGSFVYLRRIFENLIDDARSLAQEKNEKFKIKDFEEARMDEKIGMVSDQLPEFLVENRALYKILSTGIHDLSEEECLKYFETVKLGIEQILDEKIIQREKDDKLSRVRAAIQKVHGSIASSNK